MFTKTIYALAGLAMAAAAATTATTASAQQQTTQLPSFSLGEEVEAPSAAPAAVPGLLNGCPDDGTVSLDCVYNFGSFDQSSQAAIEVQQEVAAAAAAPAPQPVVLPQIDVEVTFAYNSSQLTPLAMSRLSPLQTLLSDPTVRDKPILIVGHTDSSGGYAYNQELSRQRAVSVATYVSQITGIPYDRFLPVGMGYEVLKFPHDPTAAGNRRVTVAWAAGS